MEMVSTAKSKKAVDKVNASHPYSLKIKEFIKTLGGLSSVIESPYLRSPSQIQNAGILVITANRGLCGGYNSNVLKLAKNLIQKYKDAGIGVQIYVVGKKGASFFRYQKIDVEKVYTNIDDKSGYKEAEELANLFMEKFANQQLDSVEIISTVYHSSATQIAESVSVLPISLGSASDIDSLETSTVYEPNPKAILEGLLPVVVKTAFYKAIVEAIAAEHIYRRVAMKSASDAAGDMIKILTRGYNRIRQAKITQEISEIVGGADSLK